ncbi:hypothetical protein BDF20DRAFT_846821 [Mycotypha africana]|uniref:uncharacterized protein n=1 Tax=Mycotypha africana TaxID=64632 RepID=UPI0023017C2E|nr:uncharacterized protein BDF20DRAFT_846821 [Mycotypha africana]KAI8991851.1 hypothetical protein BDF20DRAFT_846821 [Mycotypha africana]
MLMKTTLATFSKTCRQPTTATKAFVVTNTPKRYMSAYSHMSDNDPEVLEKEKQKNLSKKEKKEWNEKLASHSEAVVKADKAEDKPIKDLQQESIRHLEQSAKEE